MPKAANETLGLLVLAANTEPAFPVNPIVKMIVSDAGTIAPRTKKCAAPADVEKMLEGIKAKLYEALLVD